MDYEEYIKETAKLNKVEFITLDDFYQELKEGE